MNLLHYLETAASSVPDRLALSIGGQTCTYNDLYQHALTYGKQLRCQGLRRYDVVALVSDDCIALVEALYGTLVAGGIPTVLNPHWDETYLSRAFETVKPALILADEQHFQCSALAKQVANVKAQLELLDDGSTKAIVSNGRNTMPQPSWTILPEDPAIIIHSSGTAGKPKPVLHSHSSILQAAFQELLGFGITLSSFATTGGLYLSSAMNYLIDSLVSRGTHIIVASDDIEQYLYTIQRTAPAAARLSLHMIDAPFRRYQLSSVQMWMHGGYFLREEQARSFVGQLGSRIVSNYGATEVMGVTSLSLTSWLSATDRTSVVGKPLPGVAVRIMEDETISKVNKTTGRVVVKSASKALSYYGNPILTANHLADDWYDTGDMGFFDEHGYLHLLGRRNRDAFDKEIWLPQVELAINAHQYVKDSLVVPKDGVLTAFVEVRQSSMLTPDELTSFLRPYLPDTQMPEEIIIYPHLPRDERGKIRLDLMKREKETHV